MSARILVGDVRTRLAEIPDASVQCVVTSPPYWGLRDYGTGTWVGGDPDCEHTLPHRSDPEWAMRGSTLAGSATTQGHQQVRTYRGVCGRCGAARADLQLGIEGTPEEYVESLVFVFREVRRVLTDDGVLWLNLGDSYNNRAVSRPSSHQAGLGFDSDHLTTSWADHAKSGRARMSITGGPGALKEKDLVGIPWMVAFALRGDGWWLRQDVIWHKPNPMPESVQDRCTKSHEYVFMLTKSARYYFDSDAIAEPATESVEARAKLPAFGGAKYGDSDAVETRTKSGREYTGVRPQLRRARQLAEEAGLTPEHFAAIRAVGITDTGKARLTQDGTGKSAPEMQRLADEAKAVLGGYYREFLIPSKRNKRSVWTIPTKPFAGAHFAVMPMDLAEPCVLSSSRPGDTVLDPFAGAGTVGVVALRHGRRFLGVELNPEYAALAEARIHNDGPLFNVTEVVA